MRYLSLLIIACIAWLHTANTSIAQTPMATDSRIKTFVYNENEIFYITLYFGYQSYIELAKNEEVEALSIGKKYAFDIDTFGKKLFIKPLEADVNTNLTLITNKRTYNFEIQTKEAEEGLDEKLVYVVRFFYPNTNGMPHQMPAPAYTMPPPQTHLQPQAYPASQTNLATTPTPINPLTTANKTTPIPTKRPAKPQPMAYRGIPSDFNFDYSMTGSYAFAPLKIFDDGRYTYFQFPNNNAIIPHIFHVDKKGVPNRLSYSRKGQYIAVKKVTDDYLLKLGETETHIINEQEKTAQTDG